MPLVSLTRSRASQTRPQPRPVLLCPRADLPWPVLLRRWTLVLLLMGVAWRLVRYFLRPPIWGDEAFLCLNLADRDYLGLLRPLRFIQVAPVLFLWSERAVYLGMGCSELALRLLPLLAGLAALLLFRRLARTSVGPLAAALAVGILAVSYYPVRHAGEVKPYAFDLLAAVVLLALAHGWLRRPARTRYLAALAGLAPLLLLGSYPAVFVAGAVGLVLLPAVRRQRSPRIWLLYLAYGVGVVVTFLLVYAVVGRGQFVSAGGTENPFWDSWFPPARPAPLFTWLLAVHTGNLFAYPAGGANGASVATFLLCLVGIRSLWRTRRQSLLALLLGPFGLTFVAACLHRYPYGGSARVAQHLAPAICLLAGTGLATVLTALLRLDRDRRRAALAAFVLLAIVGLLGLTRDARRPYKTDGDRQMRQITQEIVRNAGPQDVVAVLDVGLHKSPTLEWYLRPLGSRLFWDDRVDPSRVAAAGQVWCIRYDDSPDPELCRPSAAGAAWTLARVSSHDFQLGQSSGTHQCFQVFHWIRSPTAPSR